MKYQLSIPEHKIFENFSNSFKKSPRDSFKIFVRVAIYYFILEWISDAVLIPVIKPIPDLILVLIRLFNRFNLLTGYL